MGWEFFFACDYCKLTADHKRRKAEQELADLKRNRNETNRLFRDTVAELADVKAELRLTLEALRSKDIALYDLKQLVALTFGVGKEE